MNKKDYNQLALTHRLIRDCYSHMLQGAFLMVCHYQTDFNIASNFFNGQIKIVHIYRKLSNISTVLVGLSAFKFQQIYHVTENST